MPSTYVDLSELFENLPPEGGQRSAEPQHTGWCWFTNQESYPDTAAIRAYVEAADVPVEDEAAGGSEFEQALAAAFFPMHESDSDSGRQTPGTADITWGHTLSTGPSGTLRRYSLESTGKTILFTGNAYVSSVVELLELATGLALLRGFGIDLGLFGSGPWNFELLHADTSEALRGMVTARQVEHTSACELWMICAHYMDDEMSYAVFHTEAASNVLELTFSMSFLTPKPREGGFYRALLFWRDENTGNSPWHNG